VVRKVVVVPYNPEWLSQFQAEAEQLSEILGGNVLSIDHIGSTAIPGLYAKPTIDILIVVQSHDQLDDRNDSLEALGYVPKGENGIAGRRYFKKPAGDAHLYHLHAFEQGHAAIIQHLNFRDYLRAHPEAAKAYQVLKLKLAERFPYEAQRYTEGKANFIETINAKAAF